MREDGSTEVVPLLMGPSKKAVRTGEQKRCLVTLNLQLINPDRAPHGVTGEAEHPGNSRHALGRLRRGP